MEADGREIPARLASNYRISKTELQHQCDVHGLHTEGAQSMLEHFGHVICDDESQITLRLDISAHETNHTEELIVPKPVPSTSRELQPKSIGSVPKDEVAGHLRDPVLIQHLVNGLSQDFSNVKRHTTNFAYTFAHRFLVAFLFVTCGVPMKCLNALTLDAVLGAHFDGNVHTIGGPQGDIKVDDPTYGLITAYVRHRPNTNEPRFLIAWSGKPSKNLSDEFKAFRTNLFVWLKRNTPNEDVRRNQSFQELIKCIPVSLTTQCPTQAKVKELGVGGSAKNLCQMWRQKQKKLEMKQWLENFRKSPPTESECKKAIQDNAGWERMTANSLLKLWEPRCSRRGQPNLPAKDFRQYLGTGGKGWPNLVIRSNPISGRGLVAKVAFNEGDVVCDYHGNVYRATAGAWKQNADTSYLYCFNRDANIQFSKCLMIFRFKEKNA